MIRTVLALLFVTGCAVDAQPDDDAGGGKTDDNGTCMDPNYGDGTCHLDLSCGIPDIDCYTFFQNDSDALSAVTSVNTLNTTDPHFAKARLQLDQSWELFKAHTPMGKLADERLSLVLVNDPSVNAFVYPGATPGMSYFSVYINIGLLDAGMTQDQFDGIMFHELTHLQRHHTADEVAERTRRYYVAPDSGEPIGATQIDRANAREAFESWRSEAKFSGVYTSSDLVDLPYGGAIQYLFDAFFQLTDSRVPACVAATNRVRIINDALIYNRFDQSLPISPQHKLESSSAIATLKGCLAADTMTFKDLRTALPANYAATLASLTAEDARFDDMKAFDALLGLQSSRRAKLLALQAAFATKTGRPWSAARFFSIEEEADDHSAELTKITGVNEIGVSEFVLSAMKAERSRCEAALAAGASMPYGEYLLDAHHADCWRVAHARQVANQSTRMREIPVRAPDAWVPTRVSVQQPVY